MATVMRITHRTLEQIYKPFLARYRTVMEPNDNKKVTQATGSRIIVTGIPPASSATNVYTTCL